jgi:spermidine synthase
VEFRESRVVLIGRPGFFSGRPEGVMPKDRSFPLLLLCFFLSGTAALVYETAWAREFALVFGTSELAVAMVLAAYMGGLALGAAVAARFVSRVRRPILVYGLLELGIALAALCVPHAIAGSQLLYVFLFRGEGGLGGAGVGLATSLFYAGLSLLILLIPTSMMGATLPLLVRHAVFEEYQIGSRIGVLYGVNTAGAVLGSLLAAFLLLPALGLRATIQAAAGLNLLIFLAAWAVSRSAGFPEEVASVPVDKDPIGARGVWVLPAMLVSGAISFSYEVIWFRLLVHLLGSSVQSFATMLGSFLTGVALGSALAARLATSPARAASGFALAHLGTGLLSWLAFQWANEIPGLSFATDTVSCMLLLLPAAVCIGMTFPFAVRLLARHPFEAGAASARVYSWNTFGSILGSIGAAFVLLPELGFAAAVTVCVALNLVLVCVTALMERSQPIKLVTAAVAVSIVLFIAPPTTPWNMLTTTSLGSVQNHATEDIHYFGVGRSASVLLRDLDMTWQLRINGLPEAGMAMPRTWHNSYPLTRWLTALPILARPGTKRMLVIGLGGGTALEIIPPTVERVDVVELEPQILEANQSIHGRRWRDPLSDPRIHVHLNDARNALLLTDPDRREFDAIVSQPSHPWSGGAAHLYTQEFFELAEGNLAPGGVFLQWIGTGFVDDELLRSLLSALTHVFEFVEVYQPPPGQSLLFLCSNESIDVGNSARQAFRQSPESFELLGLHAPGEILSMLRLDPEGARALAVDVRPNRDAHNRLQTHSAHLGGSALSQRSEILDAHDPLARIAAERDDTFFILRQLIPFGSKRLLRISEDFSEPVDRLLVRVFADLGRGKPRSARRALHEILIESPRHVEARATLLKLSVAAISRGEELAKFLEPPFDGAEELIASAWRLQNLDDEGLALSDLDGALAALDRIHPLWKQAVRLRIRWRLQRHNELSLREAVQLSDASLGSNPDVSDLLVRARAYAALDQYRTALDALIHVGRRFVWSDPRTHAYAHEAAKIIREVPETTELSAFRALAENSISKRTTSARR